MYTARSSLSGALIALLAVVGLVGPGATVANAIEPDPSAQVAVRVTDQSGQPVAGAVVAFFALGGSPVTEKATTADGNTVVGLPPGDYKMRVEDLEKNYHVQWFSQTPSFTVAHIITVHEGQQTLPDVRLYSTTVSGRVVDSAEVPIPGVVVQLQGSTKPEVRTDSEGRYSFARVPAGSYQLAFREDGVSDWDYPPVVEPVYLGPLNEERGRVTVLTPSPSISGRVVAADGTPVPYARVSAVWPGAEGRITKSAWASTDGRYVVRGLPAREIKVRFEAPGFGTQYYGGYSYPSSRSVTTALGVKIDDIDAVMQPESAISGRITWGTSSGPRYVNVWAFAADDPEEPVASVGADADGVYRVGGLSAGEYKLQFQPPEGNFITEWTGDALSHQRAETLSIPQATSLTGVDVELTVGGTLTGQVDESLGANVHGVRVKLSHASEADRPPVYGYVINGSVHVEGVPLGEYYVQFLQSDTHARHSIPEPVSVRPGETTTLPTTTLLRRFHCQEQPRISYPAAEGEATVGVPLTATMPSWNPLPEVAGLQWLRDGEPIVGATGMTYVPTEEDWAKRLSVRSTAWRSGYAEAGCDSQETPRVGKPMTAVTPVVITGNSWTGNVLTAGGDSWDVQGIERHFRWFLNGQPTGVSSPHYTVSNERGTLTVQVVASKAGYSPGRTHAKRLVATEVLGAEGRPAAPTGLPLVGAVLRAPDVYWQQTVQGETYQWLRNGAPIPKANGKRYSVRREDLRARLSVRITPVHPDWIPESTTSPPTSVIKSRSTLTLTARNPRRGVVRFAATVTTAAAIVPAGCVRVYLGTRYKCGRVVNGRTQITFTGVRAGWRRFVGWYMGSRDIEHSSKIVRLRVR